MQHRLMRTTSDIKVNPLIQGQKLKMKGGLKSDWTRTSKERRKIIAAIKPNFDAFIKNLLTY